MTTNAPLDLNYVAMDEVDEFIASTNAYASGEMDADTYRAYRLTRGVYGQRQDDVYMMRIKMPGGMVGPNQARVLAELCDESVNGYGSITTRSNFQIHFVPMATVPKWKERLCAAGISQVDACGNAVRTVTMDSYTGLAPDEVFDVTAFAQAITRFFLNNPRSFKMPRKFKISLSTSMADRGMTWIHDVGLVAKVGSDGEPAFEVRIGGGLASMPRSAMVMHEEWPAKDILTPLLATVDFFQAHGNRRVRSKARIKHVLRKIGPEKFTELYKGFLAKVIADPPPTIDVPVELFSDTPWQWQAPDDDIARQSGLAAWARSSVQRTRVQDKLFVTVRCDAGKLTGDQLRALADIAERFSPGEWLGFTQQQNLLIRGVDQNDLSSLYSELKTVDLARPGALHASNITSCPGTSTCNLGITHSRNAADKLSEVLAERDDDDLVVKMSGCHNSCGQHHVGTLGFYGAVKRINRRPAPHYRLMVGGGIHPDRAVFGDMYGLVPAKRVPEAVRRLLAFADGNKTADESTADYLRRAGKDVLEPVVADLYDSETATEEDFVDIGLDEPFAIIKRAGECAA
jgi:sulfite reductase (ferredoxin)